MPSYILRTIPDELWTRVKAQATGDNLPLRYVMLGLLKAYADGDIRIAITNALPKRK